MFLLFSFWWLYCTVLQWIVRGCGVCCARLLWLASSQSASTHQKPLRQSHTWPTSRLSPISLSRSPSVLKWSPRCTYEASFGYLSLHTSFSETSSSSLLLLLSRLYILELHLISFIFLFLPVFSSRLSLLTSYKFLTPISFMVLAVSMQLPQLFATPFRTQSVHLIHLAPSCGTLKHFFLSSCQRGFP